MAPNNKRSQHLNNITKSSKRLTNIKLFHGGSVSQRVQKRNGNTSLVYEDEKINADCIEQYHLDKVLLLLRERNWDVINERLLSVFVFLVLKLGGSRRKVIIETLKSINGMAYNSVELYVHRLLNNEIDTLTDDNRGKYHRNSVFEFFPDLKDHLFQFVVEKVSEKKSLLQLKGVVSEAKSYMQDNHQCLDNVKNFHVFYSIESVKSLLENWGFVWSNSKLRPFVNGHERDDVVEQRKIFVDYFAEQRDSYFVYEKINKDEYKWKIKQEDKAKRIIIAHDESTIRSGDVKSFQWLHEKYSPMFNKGRGVSRMISDFIVSHPDMTCFELSESEWNNAVKENPQLDDPLYIKKTATKIIEPSSDNYFTNETILEQFTRLILLMKYSAIFKSVNYRVDIIVDNATTHTKALVDVSMFNKGVNTHCGVDKLSWLNEIREESSIECFFQSGPNIGLSKGLFVICKELKIIDENIQSKQIKLNDLRNLAAQHPAFKRKTKLEHLIERLNTEHSLNIKLIFLPKFHCECNPIEMYWAQLKNDFRKNNNQESNGELLLQRILNSRDSFIQRDTNHRLWSRFWRVIIDYHQGCTYKEIMKNYFNSSDEIKSHRKIGEKKTLK